jgi:biotin operon repressor
MVEMAIKKKQDGKLDMKVLYMTQYWLAERLGKTREWISKSICKLEKLGLLKVIRRKKENGKWDTNLYRIGYVILRLLGLWRQAVRELINRVKSNLQGVGVTIKENMERKKENHLIEVKHSDLYSILERIGKLIEQSESLPKRDKQTFRQG